MNGILCTEVGYLTWIAGDGGGEKKFIEEIMLILSPEDCVELG